MSFDRARAIADVVLFEGYLLYPYRASALKNQYRFTFGVLAPRAWSEAGGSERSWLEAQCLVRVDGDPCIAGRLRFLRVVPRALENGSTWLEGKLREVDFLAPSVHSFEVEGSALSGSIRSSLERVSDDAPLCKLTVRVENSTPWSELDAPRDRALVGSMAGTHLLLRAEPPARFLSLRDPPDGARSAASACHSQGTHPVLLEADRESELVLCAPMILEDNPRIAPESPGDFFDASEIDELLMLRTKTLTDHEKSEVRATDRRAAEILDRVDHLPREAIEKLHGAIRGFEIARPTIPGPGTRVRIRKGVTNGRRTDAQDILFEGRIATVEAVLADVDGQEYLALSIDDDPARDLHRWYGRYLYYLPSEVEELT
jgi:hypothetical protein